MEKSVHKSITKYHRANSKEGAMSAKLVLIAISLVLVSFGTSWADGYLLVDQQNIGNIGGWYSLLNYKFDQSFTPSFSTMNEVKIALYTTAECGLRVNIREGSIDGPVIGSSEIQLAPVAPDPDFQGMAEFAFKRPLHINPDTIYYIDLELLYGTASIAVSWEEGAYPQGLLYIKDYNTTDSEIDSYDDIVFQTGLEKKLSGRQK